LYGFTIHIKTNSNLISNYSLINQECIIYKNFSFNYLKFKKFENDKIIGCNINTILQSQTAVISVSSIILS